MKTSDQLPLVHRIDSNGVAVNVNATDYGFSADGEWYNLTIPLTDIAQGSFSMANVGYVFTHICENLSQGPGQIQIDNLYLTAEEE